MPLTISCRNEPKKERVIMIHKTNSLGDLAQQIMGYNNIVPGQATKGN